MGNSYVVAGFGAGAGAGAGADAGWPETNVAAKLTTVVIAKQRMIEK